METAVRRTNLLSNHLVTLETQDVVNAYIDVSHGVGVMEFNCPPVNALSFELVTNAIQTFQDLSKNASVCGIIVKGSSNLKKFSGGAEISNFKRFSKAQLEEYMRINVQLVETIEQSTKPVVACIEGFALGGGLELAMGCHVRIGTQGSRLGLPELSLGIIPGFGGTQRLPRLVGTQKALEMMLLSKSVKGKEALNIGLVDEVVSNGTDLIPAAIKQIQLLSSKPLIKTILKTDKFLDPETEKQIISMARAQALKAVNGDERRLPHVGACISAVCACVESRNPYEGLEQELRLFMDTVKHPNAECLIHFFFAKNEARKVPGVTNAGLVPRNIRKVGVLGGGTMGSGIATALLLSGFSCVIKEVNQQFLDQAVNKVKQNLQRRVQSGRLSEEAYEKLIHMLRPTLDYSGFRELDMVIEAVIENLPLKQKIFQELEQQTNPQCILATNTSSINLDLIAAKTKSQDRIIGTHFFSPAHVMQLLEIVRTNSVSKQTIVDALGIAASLGKVPIVVGNCPGFTVNRIFGPYSQTAYFLLSQGVDMYHIDKQLESFGFPMGVFKMVDLSGIDVMAYVIKVQRGDKIDSSPLARFVDTLLNTMISKKRLGQKTSIGFYKYNKSQAIPDDPEMRNILETARHTVSSKNEIKDTDIVEMILYTVVNEAARVLDEKMAIRSSDIDVGSILGYGFPAYRGGIMKWAEMEGFTRIESKLKIWSSKFDSDLFQPCSYLSQLAKARSNIYLA